MTSEPSDLRGLSDTGVRALLHLVASVAAEVECPGCHQTFIATDGVADSTNCPNCGFSLATDDGSGTTAQLPTKLRLADPPARKAPPSGRFEVPATIGRYEIRKTLGVGGYGRVFLAYDPVAKRELAIKTPRPEKFKTELAYGSYVERFLDEGHRTAKLQHAGIVKVFEVARDPVTDTPYIAMEYVDGGTLYSRMKTKPPLSRLSAAKIVAEAAEAIHFAHTQTPSLYHCDLKPTNILLTKHGRTKVADFGLAVHEDEQLEQEGQVAGTLPYMSTEQLDGLRHQLDGRTDIWSLGVILYELLAHRRPFEGDERQVREAIQSKPVRPLAQRDALIPSSYDKIVARCLEKRVERRYPTADELAKQLRSAILEERLRLPALRSRKSILIAVAMIMVALILVTASLTSRKSTAAKTFFIDVQAVPGKSLALFEHPLREFAVQKQIIPSWAQDPAGAWVTMNSRHYEILDLGTTFAQDFEASVEIKRTDWVGEVGFCLGVTTKKLESGDLIADFQGVWVLGDYETPCRIERKILQARFEPDLRTYRIVSSTAIIEAPIPTPSVEKFHRLDVSVLGGAIVEIRWNGLALDGLVEPSFVSDRPLPAPRGALGLANFRGASEFRNCTIAVTSKEQK